MLREEVGAAGKLYLIFVVWIALVVVTTFYCYFCEQRLFSKRRNMGEWAAMRKSGLEQRAGGPSPRIVGLG